MATNDVPRPGMGQDEKDRLGLAQIRALQRHTWMVDGDLDGATRTELLEEATKRRVPLTADQVKSKTKLIEAVRAVDPDAGKAKAKGEAADVQRAADALPEGEGLSAAERAEAEGADADQDGQRGDAGREPGQDQEGGNG